MSNFKIGDVVVRIRAVDSFKYGVQPLKIVGFDPAGDLKFEQDKSDSWGWIRSYFDFYKPLESEVKPVEQSKVDRKLRLTDMQKEAIQAGINALYRHQESLEYLEEQRDDPSLTYHVEICKYQQEVLRSMLREVNR